MRFVIYADVRGEWRWRLVAGNNRIMADSAEGYTREEDCADALAKIIATTPEATVVRA